MACSVLQSRLAPVAAQDMHWLLAGLGTLGILYGAVATTAQSNLRGVVAYGSISHVGLALFGLASFSAAGLQATVLLLLGLTLATGGSFLSRRLAAAYRYHGSDGTSPASANACRGWRVFPVVRAGWHGHAGNHRLPGRVPDRRDDLQEHSGAALAALFGMIVGAGASWPLPQRLLRAATTRCGGRKR